MESSAPSTPYTDWVTLTSPFIFELAEDLILYEMGSSSLVFLNFWFVGMKLNTLSVPDEALSFDVSLSDTFLLRVLSLGALESVLSFSRSNLVFLLDFPSLIWCGISIIDCILGGTFPDSSSCFIFIFF